MNTAKTIAAFTLGCKVNAYDTQAMLELFQNKGYQVVDFTEKAGVYLINTCTVTNLGDKKSRQLIRRAVSQNPEAVVVAAGCYAQVAPDELSGIEGVNLVIGTKDRNKIVELVESYEGESPVCRVYDIQTEKIFEPLNINRLRDRTRAFVKIQEGCENFCSYCIVPYARGPVRSRPLADIINEVRTLAAHGFQEIVLAGIQVSSYGKDLKRTDLLDVIEQAHLQEGIRRIRLSSVEPGLFTPDFMSSLSKLPKICDHFHLSLQSGCDRTLKRMNRRYTASEYADTVRELRRLYPGVSLTTDVIVGFPGESENDFLESYSFIKDMALSKLHVFPYSRKKGTKASAMPEQISPEIKKDRLNRMLALDKELSARYLERFIGRELDLLFETRSRTGYYEGHTTNYCKVSCESEEDLRGRVVPVKILSLNENLLIGCILL